MKSRNLVLLLCLLMLSSCASIPTNLRMEGDRVMTDDPKLCIIVKEEVAEFETTEKIKRVVLADSSMSPIFLDFYRNHDISKLDYYYGLSHIASNENYYYLGAAHFKDHEWAKVAKAYDDGIMVYGYLTRKVDDFIFIFMAAMLDDEGIIAFNEYRSTMNMPEDGKKLIKEHFDMFHSTLAIEY